MILIQRRKELGITATQLGAQLGLCESAVNKWEKGVAFPNGDTCLTLAKILGLEPGDILLAIQAEKQKRQCTANASP